MIQAEKQRREYILTYAIAAVQSGRLTLEQAVKEARDSWERQEAAKRQATRVLEILDQLDAIHRKGCPSCKALPGRLHTDDCAIAPESTVREQDCMEEQS